MKKRLSIFLVLFLFLLSGCAEVPLTSTTLDSEAKKFQPVPGKSLLYIYREPGWGDMARKYPLTLDGNLIGEIAVQTYMVMTVSPGKHRLFATGHNTSVLDVTTEAGKIYYVWLEVGRLDFSKRILLHLVDNKRGQEGVRAAKRAITLAPLK